VKTKSVTDRPFDAAQQHPPKAGGWAARARALWGERFGSILFVISFVLPTALAVLFFGLIASDRYVSEAQFIVRSVSRPAAEGAGAYLRDFGIMRANDDIYAIQAFLKSRDAMEGVEHALNLREIYRAPGADTVTRYHAGGGEDTREALYRYFIRQVGVEKDQETGITKVHVSAYRATDAQAILNVLVRLSEARVNVMNERARRDAVSAAERNFAEAARELAATNAALTQYRDREAVVDPAQSAGAALEQGTAIDQELASSRVQLQSFVEKAPRNPAIAALRRKIAALEAQAGEQRRDLTGGPSAISGKLGGYEDLFVRRELAEKKFESAQVRLQSARQEAENQQVYIEMIARPSLPDQALEPRRLRYIGTVALISAWAFMILYLLVAGSREHLNLS